MITWAKVLNVSLAFLKKRWKEVLLLAVVAALFAKLQVDYRSLEKAYTISESSLRSQLDSMKDLHAEELRLRDEAVEKYKREVQKIKEDYEREIADLNTDRVAEAREISEEIIERKQLSVNKKELAEKIKSEFGFDYVP